MSETKPNTPADFSVEAQSIADEDMDAVTGGMTINPENLTVTFTARTYF